MPNAICVASCCVSQTAEMMRPIVVPQIPCNIVSKNIQTTDPSAGTCKNVSVIFVIFSLLASYLENEDHEHQGNNDL